MTNLDSPAVSSTSSAGAAPASRVSSDASSASDVSAAPGASEVPGAGRPVLYSFRRCPYAMRARMALLAAGIAVELREVVLRDKPPAMIAASPKATVPVLVLGDGTVIDESLEIMVWALAEGDPHQWLSPESGELDDMLALISRNDGPFKMHLDRYKYASRYEDADPAFHRAEAEKILNRLDGRLAVSEYLFGSRAALADFAIAPFVRQFARTDQAAFDAMPFIQLQAWLEKILATDFFKTAMTKFAPWQDGDTPVIFGAGSRGDGDATDH